MFYQALAAIEEFGLYEVLNPFIIIFVVTYAMLYRIPQLYDRNGIKVGISLSIAGLFIAPAFTGIGPNLVPVINWIMPWFALTLVAILCVLLVLGTLGMKVGKNLFRRIILFVIVLDLIIPDVLLFTFLAARFDFPIPSWLEFIRSDTFINFLLAVGVFVVIVWFITREEDSVP
jgi:hypothetical protein